MYNTTEERINNWKQNIIKKQYCQVMFTIFKVLPLIGQENILTLKFTHEFEFKIIVLSCKTL